MQETYEFVKRFFLSPKEVGSLFPSSHKLGMCIANTPSFLPPRPNLYLEVGAGSGALTSHILKKMLPGDRLDLVESDPKFCLLLRHKFGHLPQVTLHEISILDFKSGPYDSVISSLPLNAFKARHVNEILKKYESLVKKGGSLAYFEYLGLEKLKQVFLFGKSSSDFKNTLFLKNEFIHKYGKEVDHIWWNFPPARVIHCQL